MTKEQFIALGLTEEQAAKAAEESTKELAGYVLKQKFEEVNTENKNPKVSVKENETALEQLKKSTGDAAALTEQIQKLQDEAKEKEEKHQGELKELKLNNAIRTALAGKVQDEDIVTSLIDKSKLILGDDGKVTGLEEQVKNLKETKMFLFKESGTSENRPGFHKMGASKQDRQVDQEKGPLSMKDAIKAQIEPQMQQAD